MPTKRASVGSRRRQAEPGAELKSAEAKEIERLKRELDRVTMERDILRKATAYFAKESK